MVMLKVTTEQRIQLLQSREISVYLCVIFNFFIFVFYLADVCLHRKKMLKSVKKICNDMRKRRRNRQSFGEEGGREGGREESDGDVGGVDDCFSYFKSGPADRSSHQTTGYSGLCVSVTGGWEGFLQLIIALPVPLIFFSVFIFISCLTATVSYCIFFPSVFTNIFALMWV